VPNQNNLVIFFNSSPGRAMLFDLPNDGFTCKRGWRGLCASTRRDRRDCQVEALVGLGPVHHRCPSFSLLQGRPSPFWSPPGSTKLQKAAATDGTDSRRLPFLGAAAEDPNTQVWLSRIRLVPVLPADPNKGPSEKLNKKGCPQLNDDFTCKDDLARAVRQHGA